MKKTRTAEMTELSERLAAQTQAVPKMKHLTVALEQINDQSGCCELLQTPTLIN
jgi:hypothetical protein